MTEETCTRSEFAKSKGWSASYVTELIKNDRLVLTADGKRIRVGASLERLAQTKDPSKSGVAARHAAKRESEVPAPQSGELDLPMEPAAPDYQSAKAKKEHYLALKAEQDYLVSAKELLHAGDVRKTLADVTNQIRLRFEQLPAVLASQVVEAASRGESEVRVLLDAELRRALADLVRGFDKAGRGE